MENRGKLFQDIKAVEKAIKATYNSPPLPVPAHTARDLAEKGLSVKYATLYELGKHLPDGKPNTAQLHEAEALGARTACAEISFGAPFGNITDEELKSYAAYKAHEIAQGLEFGVSKETRDFMRHFILGFLVVVGVSRGSLQISKWPEGEGFVGHFPRHYFVFNYMPVESGLR